MTSPSNIFCATSRNFQECVNRDLGLYVETKNYVSCELLQSFICQYEKERIFLNSFKPCSVKYKEMQLMLCVSYGENYLNPSINKY